MRTFFSLFELLRLALRYGPRLDNSWWTWRRTTAFGSDPQARPSPRDQRRATLDYARWVHDMRRFTK